MAAGYKIAFFGSSLVSAYWNGAATYYRGIIHALYRMGHQVTFYEPDAYDRQKHRDIPDPHWAQVKVYTAKGTRGVQKALRDASSADVIIKASGVGVFDELLEAGVAELRRPGRPVIFWDVDAPATLDRMYRNPGDLFLTVLRDYDLVLTYGGGAPVVRGYQQLGASQCIPIYNALDPDTHYPGPKDKRFAGDLSFLGNRLPDREERVEQFFFAAATAQPRARFVLGGNGWADRLMPANVRWVGHVYTRDHNSFNCSASVVLNISRASMARMGYSPATRVFEAAGAASCIITDAWKGIEMFLEPGREVLVARDGAEVAAHLEDLSSERARQIGIAAMKRVLAEHTYTHRAAQVDQILRREVGLASHLPRRTGTQQKGQADAGTTRTRRPGAVDHVVVGERPRHHVSRPGPRVGRARA